MDRGVSCKRAEVKISSVVNLTLPYINSEVVIPAPYQVRGKLSQARNDKYRNPGVIYKKVGRFKCGLRIAPACGRQGMRNLRRWGTDG
jgi:hypothetical protein